MYDKNDGGERHANLRDSVNFRRQHNEDLSRNAGGAQLSHSVETKIRTTFIGSIAAFQEAMGFLWGDGKPLRDLTPQELEYRRLWLEVRDNVLNNGNKQLRAAKKEISEYNVEQKKFNYKFNNNNDNVRGFRD
jgi:hypothetical protein